MQQFNTLGELLEAWRSSHSYKWLDIARDIGVGDKDIRRWRNGTHSPSEANLRQLAQTTELPKVVWWHLLGGCPVYVDLNKRRFSILAVDDLPASFREDDDCSNKDPGWFTSQTIHSEKEIAEILDYDHRIYATSKPLNSDVVLRGSSVLPAANLIIRANYCGVHCGHLVCLPLTESAYARIREGSCEEGDLVTQDIADMHNETAICYVYSMYAAHSSIGIHMFRRALDCLSKWPRVAPEILIAGYAVTHESYAICEKVGMLVVSRNHSEYEEFNTEVVPTLYEMKRGHGQSSGNK